MTEEQLPERLAYWQNKLNLKDWHITAKFVRFDEMSDGCMAGQIEWILPNKTAAITLLDPKDYRSDLMHRPSTENTLVHELLHLHFAPFSDDYGNDKHYSMFEEQAINAIAIALAGE